MHKQILIKMKNYKIIKIYTVTNPLEQFEISNLLSLEFSILRHLQMSITNFGLYLSLAALLILMINILPDFKKVVSNKWSISLESLYATIYSIVRNQINSIKGQIFFPFIFTLFIFILINNLIGMIPYSFATTSQFVLTFWLSFTIVWGTTFLGFIKHHLKYFSLLVPAGCPLVVLPLLVLIELISYLARNISLGLRLAANILSGHTLLNILAEFTYKIINLLKGVLPLQGGIVFGLVPLFLIVAFSVLELGIGFIQAQVFVVLSCAYINDGYELH